MKIQNHWGTCALVSILSLLSTSTASAAVTEVRKGEGRAWNVTIDGIDFTPVEVYGREYVKATLRGVRGYEGIAYDEGKPELPVVRLWVDGDSDLKVEATAAPSAMQVPGSSGYLRPSVPSAAKRPGLIPHFTLNWALYLAANTVDKPLYQIEDAGSVRGVRRRLVTLFPFRYNPGGKSGSITLSFNVLQAKAPSASVTQAHRESFALVVPEKFAQSESLQRLKAFKEKLGYYVEIITNNDAKPETIRESLRSRFQYYDQSLRHAILVGTQAELPSFPSTTISGVTDHYYRSLDTEEYSKDVAAPDIGVGRFPAQNEEQLAAMVDKTIAYETGKFANEDWLRRITFIASDDSNFWQVIEGTNDYVIDRYTSVRGYTGSYPNANEVGGDKLYAISCRASDASALHHMAGGRGIINYGGHGGFDEWVKPHLTLSDVSGFRSQGGAIPWVIANACDTANFQDGNSIAEAWVRAPQGAVAYLGSMDSTYWDEDDIFERRMYDGIFENGISHLGEIIEFAKNEVWRYYGGQHRSRYYNETYVTMGDPSIAVRTWSSRGVKIWGPTTVRTGTASAKYQIVDENNIPIADARVALSSDSYDYRTVAQTDARGMVTLPLGRGSRYTVTATGANLRLASLSVRIKDPTDRRAR